MSTPAYRLGWQLRLAAATFAVGLCACGDFVHAQNPQEATANEIKAFEDTYAHNLKRRYSKEEHNDTAPAKTDLDAFTEACREFVAAPKPKVAAEIDAKLRQGSLKAMEFLAQRNAWLARCLIAIIVDQAKHYCHQFSPYSDKLQPAAETPRAATGTAMGANEAKLDPLFPLNYAQLLKNADFAIIGALVETLKKLQIQSAGDDLFEYLVVETDERANYLLLSVLSDPDVSPSAARILDYLQHSAAKRFAPARYFFIQRVMGNPRKDQQVLGALKTQLGKDLPGASDIQPAVLKALMTVTADNLKGVTNYSIVIEIANIAVNGTNANLRAAAIAVLGHLVSLIAKDDDALTLFAAEIRGSSHFTSSVRIIGDPAEDAGKRKTRVAFLGAVMPALATDPTTFPPAEIVNALLRAFGDAEYLKKNPTGRMEIADIWSSALSAQFLGDLATKKPTEYAQFSAAAAVVYDRLRLALFATTPAEQAAFLKALGAMTRKPD